MDYQKSIQSLLKEAKAGASYKQLGKPYRTFLKIALFPLYIVEFALIIAYYVQLFFYNAMMSPVTYLEAWQDKKKEGIQHATQAVLFFVTTPFIFFLRVLISLMSFNFFFLWFFLMCYTYLVTLGGINWQPCINVIPEREGGETKLRASAGEKFATVALLFFAAFVALIPFADSAYEALMVAMSAYGIVIVVVNPLVCASARMPVAPVTEATKDDPPPILELEEANRSGMFDNFVFGSLMLSFMALLIFIIAWIENGSDLFLPEGNYWYYYNYNGVAFAGVFMLILCAGMGVAKLVLSMFMGIGKPIVKNAKTILAGILVGICALSAAFGTFQYVRYLINENREVSYSSTTESEAISTAKNSVSVHTAIANELNLYNYNTPEYKSSSATSYSDGSWRVTLQGTMWGYNNNGYSTSESFTAYVTVSEYNTVMSTTVYSY